MNERKEITSINFEGVAIDGGFVFKATLLPEKRNITFKTISYVNGIMEIVVDETESISKVAKLVSGMFSRKSNFANLDYVILQYASICLKIEKSTGRKNIISMIMKAISMSKNCNNNIVDNRICQRIKCNNNFSRFHKILETKSLWFRGEEVLISSIKDGIVKINTIAGENIVSFTKKLRRIFFNEYSNFYGVKAVEVEFNNFSIKVDRMNIDRILYLYQKSINIVTALNEKEWQEIISLIF